MRTLRYAAAIMPLLAPAPAAARAAEDLALRNKRMAVAFGGCDGVIRKTGTTLNVTRTGAERPAMGGVARLEKEVAP